MIHQFREILYPKDTKINSTKDQDFVEITVSYWLDAMVSCNLSDKIKLAFVINTLLIKILIDIWFSESET